MTRRIVHVIGTGNVGEPLIGLLADFRESFGIDEVTFTKRSPLTYERAKVDSLVRRGAKLCVDSDMREEFERQGHAPAHDSEEALARATVVIDCTPSSNRSKTDYLALKGPKGYIAVGGTFFGFGKLYIQGVNDEALVTGEDRFIQIPGGNASGLACLIRLFAFDGEEPRLRSGRFVCMRRTSDFCSERGFIPSPKVLPHDVDRFGTHHAREAHFLFKTLGHDLELRSSDILLPTQLMHTIWFSLEMSRPLDVDGAIERVGASRVAARTDKQSSTLVFAFSRDHGYQGRIFSRVVVPTLSLASRGDALEGFCFVPQDSNEIFSTVAATLFFLEPAGVQDRLATLVRFTFEEV
jgi:hypothetical protein